MARHHRRPAAGFAALLAALALVAAGCSGAPRPQELSTGQVVDAGAGADLAGGGLGGDGSSFGEMPASDPAAPGLGEDPGLAAGGAPAAGGGRVGSSGSGGLSSTAIAPAGGGTQPGTATSPGGASGPAPITLFTAEEDRVGMTDTEIRLCAHAALTYGAAFNTSADDFNVYWTALNEAGGVHGRKVKAYYENDNYSPDTAVQAATACKTKYDPFMLLGGIGFDQIPAVRTWAENNRMLYFHHTATVKKTDGLRFSYTGLPTTEKMGEVFAQLAATRFPGKSVGIVKRGSENWEPGIDGFKRVAAERGVTIVVERRVNVNQGNYLQEIIDLKNAGAEVAFLWLNALESTEFVKQAKAQRYSPHFMVFPFNLMAQTLDSNALEPPIVGVAMFNAFSKGDRSGEFARYASDLDQFEQQYAKYRPGVDLGGVGGDLLFLNWSAQKAMHQLLVQCGRDCSRNRFLEVLRGYRAQPAPSSCILDFTRPGLGNDKRGGWAVSVMEAYRAPGGKVNFRNTNTCVEGL